MRQLFFLDNPNMLGYHILMKMFVFEVDKEAFDFAPEQLPDYIIVNKTTLFGALETLKNFFERLEIEEWGCRPRYYLTPEDVKDKKVLFI